MALLGDRSMAPGWAMGRRQEKPQGRLGRARKTLPCPNSGFSWRRFVTFWNDKVLFPIIEM